MDKVGYINLPVPSEFVESKDEYAEEYVVDMPQKPDLSEVQIQASRAMPQIKWPVGV